MLSRFYFNIQRRMHIKFALPFLLQSPSAHCSQKKAGINLVCSWNKGCVVFIQGDIYENKSKSINIHHRIVQCNKCPHYVQLS